MATINYIEQPSITKPIRENNVQDNEITDNKIRNVKLNKLKSGKVKDQEFTLENCKVTITDSNGNEVAVITGTNNLLTEILGTALKFGNVSQTGIITYPDKDNVYTVGAGNARLKEIYSTDVKLGAGGNIAVGAVPNSASTVTITGTIMTNPAGEDMHSHTGSCTISFNTYQMTTGTDGSGTKNVLTS